MLFSILFFPVPSLLFAAQGQISVKLQRFISI